ncbi:hypothetical protein AVI51_03700 [Piscirickettsia salmonis]|uniref:MarR family transcriptional regulator n=2 Tax=Piscirickettsia salmonis TaxID=1238 RepID=A0A095BLF2_PISSA|nr:hypothetical protein [Piscirickettsia salmonis]RNC79023.1 hypothetical protein DA717_01355 [Piscirickettsiaceae bacterium NZ-RLO2]AKP74139.1 hypothetical protein PSLF89_2466 [Piscirickettsia salmonis LF-89 = ATCC VR-1361]ALA25180.1 MarR family transcriptional regulator [Piscirickettsia salmonis]ALB23015.1 MarR family transcriptional regulator [Piscirickettsia salmonis]ALY02957.1 hypothetical protein AWE47_08970 [Piscirickettsia salmonis]
MSDQNDDVVELIKKVKTEQYAKKMTDALHRMTYEQLNEYRERHGDSTGSIFEALVFTQVGALKSILIQLLKTFAMTKGRSISKDSIDDFEDMLMSFFDEDLWDEKQILTKIPANQLN